MFSRKLSQEGQSRYPRYTLVKVELTRRNISQKGRQHLSTIIICTKRKMYIYLLCRHVSPLEPLPIAEEKPLYKNTRYHTLRDTCHCHQGVGRCLQCVTKLIRNLKLIFQILGSSVSVTQKYAKQKKHTFVNRSRYMSMSLS